MPFRARKYFTGISAEKACEDFSKKIYWKVRAAMKLKQNQ
jgi:hypothetical protein